MFNIGNELIGVSGSPYFLVGEGKRVVVLSVREREQSATLIKRFSNEKNDLLVVLEEELKGVSIAIAREMTIDYVEYLERKLTGKLLLKDFSDILVRPNVYQVSSKYFTFEKQRKQTHLLLPLRPRLTE